MSSPITMSLLTLSELGMALVLLVTFLRVKDTRQRFSAMAVYFFLRVLDGVCGNLLTIFRYGIKHHLLAFTSHQAYVIYFYLFWVLFLIGAVVIFWALLQLYSLAMAPLSGLKNLGRKAFYWVAGICLLMSFTAGLIPFKLELQVLWDAGASFMRCVSVLEICLLAILAVMATKLGLGFGSRIFGMSLGLGIFSGQYLFFCAFVSAKTSLYSALNIEDEVVQLLVIGIWLFYALRPEPARKPIMLPVTSALIRWNEIALALGFGETQVIIGRPSSKFQVSDLERAIGGVLGEDALKKSVGQIS
jgi:hypothetical protein